jgi:hypothetical protein
VSGPQSVGQPPWRGGAVPGEDTTPLPQRGAPVPFQAEPPPRKSQNKALAWVLRGLGLLAVAVISGLIWFYLNDESTPPSQNAVQPSEQQHSGQFNFAAVPQLAEPQHDSNCADHAYGDVQKFLQATPCQQLTRGLYTTTSADGRKVYANVSVVRMPTAADAAKLRELADSDGTGNVKDLVREGRVKLPPLTSLSGAGGYHAVQHDRNVIIVESDFAPDSKKGDKKKDEETLDTICVDAALLGDQIGA